MASASIVRLVTNRFVPDGFEPPESLRGPRFRFEPLGPEHNERDYEAWMSSIDHIRRTPGFEDSDWPTPMSLDANLADLVGHATDFANRAGFTYSVLDGDAVIGCIYIYPSRETGHDAAVSAWVRESRAELDPAVRRTLSDWLTSSWPFTNVAFDTRST